MNSLFALELRGFTAAEEAVDLDVDEALEESELNPFFRRCGEGELLPLSIMLKPLSIVDVWSLCVAFVCKIITRAEEVAKGEEQSESLLLLLVLLLTRGRLNAGYCC